MAALPSWVWLFVGLVVTITAWYVEMPLFFWIGWILIIVGAAKFVFRYMAREKETKQEHKTVQRFVPQARTHAAHQYYRCACGNPVRAADFFCSHCGRRLR